MTRRPSPFPGLLPLLSTAVGVAVLFQVFPGLDLAISALFYSPGRGFAAAESTVWLAVRDVARAVINATTVLLLGMFLLSLLPLGPRQIAGRWWLFLLSAWLLGPGLIANALFKEHWGRARPDSVAEFGGGLRFTPPLSISDACASNCSFVSGEAAAAAMLALLVGLVAAPHLGRRQRIGLIATLALAASAVGLLRVAMGRHFLSDTLFAALFMGMVVAVLHGALGIGRIEGGIGPSALRHDLGLARSGFRRLVGPKSPPAPDRRCDRT